MYEMYERLRDTLSVLLDNPDTKKQARAILKETPDSEGGFYESAMLDLEPHSTQIAVILSLMGISSPTATDMDKAENIFQQIQKAKEL